MGLITDKIRENAEKCQYCAFLNLRNNAEINKNNVFYDEAIKTLEGFCAVCPYRKDFEKVYGTKPYDYFPFKTSKSDIG